MNNIEVIICLVLLFMETTGWVLALRIRSGGNVLLNIDELTDVELLFRHASISRLQ